MSAPPIIPIYLHTERQSSKQRAHFSLFIPFSSSQTPSEPSTLVPTQTTKGTKIHVVGAPMTGFALEFKRGYEPNSMALGRYELVRIGEVEGRYLGLVGPGEGVVEEGEEEMREEMGEKFSVDDVPRNALEREAAKIPPPRRSENFRAPVNDTTNRRCQEWTMDCVRSLVERGILGAEAVEIVQGRRDPPGHGIV